MPEPAPTNGGLAGFNALERSTAIDRLLACLDVRRYAEEIADQRPYANTEDLLAASDKAAADLSATELDSALAAHPRIGERATGEEAGAQHSASEQSGVDTADDGLTAALHRENQEYERRFGHVYLVCASGRSGQELLDILRSRLDNDAATERGIVVDELRKIAHLRLARLIES